MQIKDGQIEVCGDTVVVSPDEVVSESHVELLAKVDRWQNVSLDEWSAREAAKAAAAAEDEALAEAEAEAEAEVEVEVEVDLLPTSTFAEVEAEDY